MFNVCTLGPMFPPCRKQGFHGEIFVFFALCLPLAHACPLKVDGRRREFGPAQLVRECFTASSVTRVK